MYSQIIGSLLCIWNCIAETQGKCDYEFEDQLLMPTVSSFGGSNRMTKKPIEIDF